MAGSTSPLDQSICDRLHDCKVLLEEWGEPEILVEVLINQGLVAQNDCRHMFESVPEGELTEKLLEMIQISCTDGKYLELCLNIRKRGCHLMAHVLQYGGDSATCDLSHSHIYAQHLLRKHIVDLNLEPVLEYLYTRRAICLEQMEAVQTKPNNNIQCDTLLGFLEEEPDWVYYCLLDALHRTEQINMLDILQRGSLHDVMVEHNWHQLYLDTKKTPAQFYRHCAVNLTKDISAALEIWDKFEEILYQQGVVQPEEWKQIKLENSSYRRQARKILNDAAKKEGNILEKLLQCLDEVNQAHIDDGSEGKVNYMLSELRKAVAELYLSQYKKIILWGTGINPVPAEFDALYTDMTYDMTWVKVKRSASVMEKEDLHHYSDIVVVWG